MREPRSPANLAVGLIIGLCLGTFLSLWLSSQTVERVLDKMTKLFTTINPPPEQPTSTRDLFSMDTSELDPSEDLPAWARPGMDWEDLQRGVDPLTGRPLR